MNNTPVYQTNERKVALAFNDVSGTFDDQYSLLLLGKMTTAEFSEYMKKINNCMANVAVDHTYLNIARGIVLTFLATSFFILPGVLAASIKPKNTSIVVLASAGLCGVAFFCSTVLFICLYHKVELKGSNNVKSILAEFNKVCNTQGLNWRLVDSQLFEFETVQEDTNGQSTIPLQQRRCHHLPRQWIEIEITFPGYKFEYYEFPKLPIALNGDPYPYV